MFSLQLSTKARFDNTFHLASVQSNLTPLFTPVKLKFNGIATLRTFYSTLATHFWVKLIPWPFGIRLEWTGVQYLSRLKCVVAAGIFWSSVLKSFETDQLQGNFTNAWVGSGITSQQPSICPKGNSSEKNTLCSNKQPWMVLKTYFLQLWTSQFDFYFEGLLLFWSA